MSGEILTEVCRICQQKAFGFNYEVISCKACKMFFRRVSIKGILQKCKFGGKCFEADNCATHRPRCSPCRYQKCIQVGMQTFVFSSEATALVPRTLVTEDHTKSALLQNLSVLNETRREVLKVINVPGDVSFCDLVAQGSKLGEYMQPNNITWSLDQGKLKPWMSLGTILIVDMCKTMDFYNELLLSDRVLLLRAVAYKSNILSMAFDSYCRKKAKMYTPEDYELIPPILNHIPECRKFVESAMSAPMKPLIDLKISENEFLLLNMIIICDPTVPGLSPGGQNTLFEHRKIYSKLLLDHCLLQNSREGAGRFAAIISINQLSAKTVYVAQKFVYLVRTHWSPNYFPSQIIYDSCRMNKCEWLKDAKN